MKFASKSRTFAYFFFFKVNPLLQGAQMTIHQVCQYSNAIPLSTAQLITGRRLVLIDAGIYSPEVLEVGVLPDSIVQLLDPNCDGIEQISEALQRHPGISSLHLVSHGAPGRIYVGNTELSLETLDRYSNRLMRWAEWLAPDAELLIYGCEVAKGERGRSFIARLSELTGASGAASTTETGAAALGKLESRCKFGQKFLECHCFSHHSVRRILRLGFD
jgi:Domain of unknown function (DUF4347)